MQVDHARIEPFFVAVSVEDHPRFRDRICNGHTAAYALRFVLRVSCRQYIARLIYNLQVDLLLTRT